MMISIDEQILFQTSKVTKLIEYSIVPLHTPGPYKVPFIGSSIYLKIEDIHFLVTATHVIEEFSSAFTIPKQTKKQNILFFGDASPETDISVARLVDPLEVFRPLPFELISNRPFVPGSFLIASGYPSTKVKQYNRIIKTTLQALISKDCTPEEYNLSGVDANYSIAMRFEPNSLKTSNLQKTELPYPNGMSGGGLFSIRSDFLVEEPDPRLVGILVRWDADRRRNIVATKIEYVLAAIKSLHSELKIPADFFSNVKVSYP